MEAQPIPATRQARNPDQTRRRILEAAFQQMYRNGFQGMRLGDVLAHTGLTKGALYHHFPNKLALGYAVVDELILQMVYGLWVEPLSQTEDPLETMIEQFDRLDEIAGETATVFGCPLNNLAQEMAPLDEGFRERLDKAFTTWRSAFVEALERSKALGRIREDVDTGQVATVLMAAIEGCIGLAKSSQSSRSLRECGAGLASYLRTLNNVAVRS